MAVVVTHATQATLPNDPTKEVSSDAWNEGHEVTGLATVAESGSYNDLADKPTVLTLADVIDALYPVGAIYTSTLSTNPATLLGRGTWSAFGAGRVMVGRDANDTDFDTAEETGGAKTVASSGTVSQPTFTGSALATHSHGAGTLAPSAHSGAAVGDHAAHTHSVTSNVTVADHAAHTHSVTAAGTNSAPTFTGSALATHTHELPFQIPSTTTTRQIASATFGTGTSRAATAVSANGTANTTSAAVALSEAKSAGTPAGTVSAPTFTGSSVTSGNPSATLTHTPTNNAVTSGNPSATLTHSVTQPGDHTMSGTSQSVTAGTPAGTVSQPTFTGDATSVVQPYIVVFSWKRTA